MIVHMGILIIFFFPYINCLNSNEENICENKTTGINYCCSDFEEQNGKCVECKEGYSSFPGSSCEPCAHNWYGARCFGVCNCEEAQRCDNVIGCINITESDIMKTGMVTQSSRMTETDKPKGTFTEEDKVTDKPTGFPLSKREIVFYSISVGCFIISLGLCNVFIKYRYKRTYRRRLELVTQALQNTSTVQRDESLGRNEGFYTLIDENDMVELNLAAAQVNPYLEVVNSSTSSTNSNNNPSSNLNVSGYLNPYQPLTYDRAPHPQYENEMDREEREGEVNSHLHCYSNLYQMLIANTKNSSHYYDKLLPTSILGETDIRPCSLPTQFGHHTKSTERPLTV